MNAAHLLDSMLKKKWLSSNTVRDGLIACFTLTLVKYADQTPLSKIGIELPDASTGILDESSIYHKVLKTSQDAFRALNIDDEYPSKDHLMKLKSIMEEQLAFEKLSRDDPTLVAEHHRISNLLLSKME
jgi:hypothetical protein